MDDRRTKQRLEVRLNAMWDSSTEAHSAQITNLSEGGCYLDSVGEVRRGEIVGFRVLLPDDDWLYLEGEVRHHSAGGVWRAVCRIERGADREAAVAVAPRERSWARGCASDC